jgi:hypothetical protein
MEVILSNIMQPITNQQTPPLAILGQKHLTGYRYNPGPNKKNTPIFCHKKTKGKTEYQKNHK